MDPKFGFGASPFSLAANRQSARYWAGRPDVLKRVTRLLSAINNKDDSSIDLIWANFGAGKTHALYFIENQINSQSSNSRATCVELSESARNFADIYRLLTRQLDWTRLLVIFRQTKLCLQDDDLSRALRVMENGSSDEQQLAIGWLFSDPVDLRRLKTTTNIQRRIEEDRQCISILASAVQIAVAGGGKLVFLFDEFQRIGQLPEKRRSAITSGIRMLFNSAPMGMSLVFAMTTGMEQTAAALLPAELRTIIGPKPAISLPELTPEEAVAFCTDRLAQFRAPAYKGDPTAPFGLTGLEAIAAYLDRHANIRLTPRNILHALSWIYDDTVSELRDSWNEDEIFRTLDQLSWDTSA